MTAERGAPFGLQIHTVQVRGTRATYVDEGEGRVVLLLHGAPLTSLGFARVVHELRTTNRVIAPDLPGFGGSDIPEGFRGRLSDHADFVVEFCSRLGLADFVMFVNDSSGCIGLAAATHLPVAGLVIADTVPIPLRGAARPVAWVLRCLAGSRLVRFVNRRYNFLPWLVATVAPLLRPFSRAQRRALCAEFDSADKRDRVLDLFGHMATDVTFMGATAESTRVLLAEVPALILFGRFDPMRLVGGVGHYRRMFRDHRVVVVPIEEHFPILASGTRVATALREWMTSHPRLGGSR